MKKAILVVFIILTIGVLISVLFVQNKKPSMPSREIGKKEIVREPAVAGAFYPSDKKELQQMVEEMLNKASSEKPQNKELFALIVPHAGYQFSGPVAAQAYNLLRGEEIETVIIIGNSHHHYFDGISIFKGHKYKTPLGEVEVDREMAESLIGESERIFSNPVFHQTEHSIEVQLPFLQEVLGDFKIVPILFGNQRNEDFKVLASAILKNIKKRKRVLIIASSDLSHYPKYEDAQRVDHQTIKAILTGDVSNFEKTISLLEKEKVPGALTFACGQDAIKTVMVVAKAQGAQDIELIKYANSGDSPFGEKSRVVGYGAIAFFKKKEVKEKTFSLSLTLSQKQTLLEIARSSVESFIKNRKMPEFKIDDPVLNEHLGAFVTLKKHGALRGCIGTFSPTKIPLWQVVSQMAIAAATRDLRFYPVTQEELPLLSYEISILTPLQRVSSWEQIRLGKDGVQIKKGSKSGVFLPQVAEETGWDLETFLRELCTQKAGLNSECYKDPQVEIYVFQALVFSDKEIPLPSSEKEGVLKE